MATYAIRYIELPNGDVCDFGLFGIPYGACATAASTQAKAVTISGIATLREGLSIRVKFNNAQNYNGTPTLNLNSLGAKSIYRNGATPAKQYEWATGDVLDLVYDGTNWIIVNGGALNTAYTPITLTAGSGVTISLQDCYLYGKLLFVSMTWSAASNIPSYSTIASFKNYTSKMAWSAPLTTVATVVVANNGLYADKNNSMIRASTTIPAGTYKTFLIIPVA